ncbi:UNVERIFIED_ORG: hypothetical protein M2312_003890 [Rhizobium esperanzae]|nr:hypothetical protein [Rhizobium esperanzae]
MNRRTKRVLVRRRLFLDVAGETLEASGCRVAISRAAA